MKALTLTDMPTALYRFYDAGGQLLYVGITCRTAVRFRDHQKTAEWWPRQRSVTVAWRPDRDTAAAEELVAIREEKPLYNLAGRLPTQPRRHPRRQSWPPPDLRGAIAADVRAEIGRAGRPKSEIRAVLGMNTNPLSDRLRGDVAFRREELDVLAAHLGIPVERFWTTAASFAFEDAA